MGLRRSALPTTVGVLAAVLLAAGCGSDGHSAKKSAVPGDDVALVGGTQITKADFSRELHAVTKAMAGSGAAIPADPPAYTGCIAQLRKLIAQSTSHLLKGAKKPPTASTAQLKTQCVRRDQGLRVQTTSTLIQSATPRTSSSSRRPSDAASR